MSLVSAYEDRPINKLQNGTVLSICEKSAIFAHQLRACGRKTNVYELVADPPVDFSNCQQHKHVHHTFCREVQIF